MRGLHGCGTERTVTSGLSYEDGAENVVVLALSEDDQHTKIQVSDQN